MDLFLHISLEYLRVIYRIVILKVNRHLVSQDWYLTNLWISKREYVFSVLFVNKGIKDTEFLQCTEVQKTGKKNTKFP